MSRLFYRIKLQMLVCTDWYKSKQRSNLSVYLACAQSCGEPEKCMRVETYLVANNLSSLSVARPIFRATGSGALQSWPVQYRYRDVQEQWAGGLRCFPGNMHDLRFPRGQFSFFLYSSRIDRLHFPPGDAFLPPFLLSFLLLSWTLLLLRRSAISPPTWVSHRSSSICRPVSVFLMHQSLWATCPNSGREIPC